MQHIIFQRLLAVHLLIVLSALLTNCGYQLQKPLEVDAALEPVYVSEATALGIEIKRELLRQGVSTTNDTAAAGSTINLVDAQNKNRSLSLAGDGRVAEYLASAKVVLVWQDMKQRVLSSTPLQTDAIRLARPNTPLAQHAESSQIQQELVRELAQQAILALSQQLALGTHEYLDPETDSPESPATLVEPATANDEI